MSGRVSVFLIILFELFLNKCGSVHLNDHNFYTGSQSALYFALSFLVTKGKHARYHQSHRSHFFKYLFIPSAVLGLNCCAQHLQSSLWDAGYFVVACELLVAGSSSLNRAQIPCIGSAESQPLDHQGSPHHSYHQKGGSAPMSRGKER